MSNPTSRRGNAASGRRNRNRNQGGEYNARFAGEIFAHLNNPADGPTARKQTSEVAWKRPPSSSIRAEVSV
jgi:hypothetical protein